MSKICLLLKPCSILRRAQTARSLLFRLLTTAIEAFKGPRDTLKGVCAGTGVKTCEPLLLRVSAVLPVHCQDGWLCLSPFVCLQLPQDDSWCTHMTSSRAHCGLDWWIRHWRQGGRGCWQPVKVDFRGRLAVPVLSDQFGGRGGLLSGWWSPLCSPFPMLRWCRCVLFSRASEQ